jgi:transcriptional regulator with XRE-family HTH domain
METTKQVADAVRAEMARNRVTQESLAVHLHLSQAAVSRRLKGIVVFKIDELVQTAQLVGVSVGTLIGERAAA